MLAVPCFFCREEGWSGRSTGPDCLFVQSIQFFPCASGQLLSLNRLPAPVDDASFVIGLGCIFNPSFSPLPLPSLPSFIASYLIHPRSFYFLNLNFADKSLSSLTINLSTQHSFSSHSLKKSLARCCDPFCLPTVVFLFEGGTVYRHLLD